jgi:molybdopterin converting factor subunit 1
MQCTVLVFAQLAETLGTDRVSLELAAGSTITDALDTLTATHPVIAKLRPVLAVAINDCYCNTATTLNDGDTLALIPPVSGG